MWIRTTFAVIVIAAVAGAQSPEALASASAGLLWQGSSGNFAISCVSFSCTPTPVTVVPGETVTITVSGIQDFPYLLVGALGAGTCQSFPGVQNSLALDSTVQLLASGVMAQPNNVAPCGFGMDQIVIPVPSDAPVGASIVIQSVSWGLGIFAGGMLPTFTTPIEATVQ